MENFPPCITGFVRKDSFGETTFLNLKNRLMTYRTFVNRLIILGFMGLVGFCLAKAISVGSFLGILLALVSFGAGIYFLYILAKAKEEMRSEEAAQ